VQFMHPGGEHGEDQPGHKNWNRALHRRKFLLTPGQYLAGPNTDPVPENLAFWGEWEPESQVERIGNPVPGGPRWQHRPYYVRPVSYPGDLQNTDPFVFGEAFLYTLCRQTKPIGGLYRPTFLRDLAPGSLILFGSLKRGEFVLDTVFVVADGVLHNGDDWSTSLEGQVSETYVDVTVRPTYQTAWPHKLRLYVGATPATRVEGMFSFAPCRPVKKGDPAFPRPVITLPGVITPGLMMGAKATRDIGLVDVAELWKTVVSQVLDQDLLLGTHFSLPPRRDA
jgi:hypothetical protein